jgi:hypothetical protein
MAFWMGVSSNGLGVRTLSGKGKAYTCALGFECCIPWERCWVVESITHGD